MVLPGPSSFNVLHPWEFPCTVSMDSDVPPNLIVTHHRFATPVPPKDLIADQAEPGARRKYMEKLPENVLNDVSHLDTDWKGTRGFRT
ncbi:hypothetical protein IFM51744_01482 [Aspergillus udagawae]|uniref:Uncharacterized protein n=1 Tax=Aspergillus udagawae TaxID=91492 RepID=A0ABQ1BFC2_9EURO|nr:hypothetical protein IFM51744_01482 [Aspergillus udagawae]GFG01015.1 hypothetical protein IFM53868_10917 [Aspergillus udagawae]GFG19256.1 hypothetical protein IFM5058_09878 [Aspergillus udagawae]